MSQRPDPVLVRLGEWARERGLTREDVARAVGVQRPTAAGWFLGLEAAQRGELPPKSAREFRFTNQRPEVQERIAAVLARPVDLLRAESLGTPAALSAPFSAPAGEVPVGSEVWDVAQALIGGMARSGLGPATLAVGTAAAAHRLAAVVDSVAGVAGTSVVAVHRGQTRSVLWQYQIVVHAHIPADGASRAEHARRIRDEHARRIRADVDRALTAAGLTAAWEHGAQRPEVLVSVRDKPLLAIGSLISPVATTSRPPRSGLLVRAQENAAARDLRVGVVLSGDYGGNTLVASGLSEIFGAGYLRSKEVVRAVRLSQAERGAGSDRGALLTQGAARDAGFILHLVQNMLERGDMPGAWLLSLEAEQVDYPPLRLALLEMSGLVVVVRMDSWWQRLAAWRLAAAKCNEQLAPFSSGSTEQPASSDWIRLEQDCPVAEVERAALRRQARCAAELLPRIEREQRRLADLIAERSRACRLTVVVDLERPQRLRTFSWSGPQYRAVPSTAEPPGDEQLAFCDDVDSMVDAWANAAAAALDEIAVLAGHASGQDFIDPAADDVVTAAYRLRTAGTA